MVKNNKKGFTIIEVVLVLAIAGLIFLMVFIALPALQRSQRNTQRKNDLSRFVTAATSSQANNNNKIPSTSNGGSITKSSDFVKRYIIAGGGSDQFADPDGEDYSFLYATWNYKNSATTSLTTDKNIQTTFGLSAAPSFNHVIYYVSNAKCSPNEGQFRKSSGKNDFAMMYILEGGSFACNDNQ